MKWPFRQQHYNLNVVLNYLGFRDRMRLIPLPSTAGTSLEPDG